MEKCFEFEFSKWVVEMNWPGIAAKLTKCEYFLWRLINSKVYCLYEDRVIKGFSLMDLKW